MQADMQAMKTELLSGQEGTAERVAKRLRRKTTYEFRRKGNKRQHEFNETVAEQLDDAAAAVIAATPDPSDSSPKDPTSALQKAKAAIDKGNELIVQWQKLIKIADRSDYGWDVVQEYQEDEFAADSDDEKRLAKAERAAEKRVTKRKQSASKQRRPTWQKWQPQAPATQLRLPVGPTSAGTAPQQFAQLRAPYVPVNRQVGPCFGCGGYGHLRRTCPKASAGGAAPGAPGRTVPYPHQGYSLPGVVRQPVEESGMGDREMPLLRDWELKEPAPPTDTVLSVQGRLRSHNKFWQDTLQASSFALGVVKEGYVLPLKSPPPPYSRPNQQSTRENPVFVTEAVLELLRNHCIGEVPCEPHGCHPLAVVTSGSRKLRLVINLRHLNKFLWSEKFKYEDLRVAMQFFEKGDYMFTFDLKSGYHHVDIVQHHWQYLGFQWAIDGKPCYFVFRVLPFGLSTACYAFTKLLRPLVKYWRGMGLRITVYLDDGICVAKGAETADTASRLVQETLDKAGFVVNQEKSVWQPATTGCWLGFNIDLAGGEIAVPPRKIEALDHSLLKQIP